MLMNMDRYKREHIVILTDVSELRTLVEGGISENADGIAKAIVSMSSKIKLHLAAEDQFVYPALASSADPAVAKLGKKFQEEMGGIAVAFMEFVGRWNLASKVAANPEGFRADANNIFKALHQRIQNENQKLYPLVEQT
jgi:hemerythrin-like domain-containing protein